MKSTRESIITLLAEDIRFIADRRAEKAFRQTYEMTANVKDATYARNVAYSVAIAEMKAVFQD